MIASTRYLSVGGFAIAVAVIAWGTVADPVPVDPVPVDGVAPLSASGGTASHALLEDSRSTQRSELRPPSLAPPGPPVETQPDDDVRWLTENAQVEDLKHELEQLQGVLKDLNRIEYHMDLVERGLFEEVPSDGNGFSLRGSTAADGRVSAFLMIPSDDSEGPSHRGVRTVLRRDEHPDAWAAADRAHALDKRIRELQLKR